MLDDPANVYLRALRGQIYGWLGEAYVAVASSTSSDAERKSYWQNARSMYELGIAGWKDLQHRGLLPADDVKKLEKFTRELARCDAALADQ